MYLELLVTATAVQQDLSNAYIASGRKWDLGAYFVALNYTTLKFFEQIEPPPDCEHLHAALLKWQSLGLEALTEELKAGAPVESEISQRFAEATKEFTEAMNAFLKSTQSV